MPLTSLRKRWMRQFPRARGNGNGGGNGGGAGTGGTPGPGGGNFNATPTLFLPFTNSLQASINAGVGTPTYSCANADGTILDWEGLLRRTKANEARFMGARRVENLLVATGTLAGYANVSGGAGAANPTVTNNFATDPLGGNTANRIQLNKGTDAVNGYSEVYGAKSYSSLGGVGIRAHRGSIWMKSNSGTPTVMIRQSNNTGPNSTNGNATFILDGTWRRYTTPVATGHAGADIYYFEFGLFGTTWNDTGTPCSQTADILVWGPMLENVAGQSNQNPSEYISNGVLASPYHYAGADGVKYFSTKNGNTVASGIVTEATGAAINTGNGASSLSCDATGPFGLLLEQNQNQSGNLMTETNFNGLYSSKTGLTVTNLNAVSPMGETMAAALIETAINNFHTIGVFGSVSSQTNLMQSVFVKAGTRDAIGLRLDPGGGNHCDVTANLTSGIVSQTANGTTVAKGCGIQQFGNGWYRVWQMMQFSSTAGGASMTIFANGFTSYLGVAGNTAIYCWGSQVGVVQDYDAIVRPLSYSLGSRGTDSLTYTFASNANATVGTAYAEVRSNWTTTTQNRSIVAFDAEANNLKPLTTNASDVSTAIRARDGTNSVQKTGISDLSTAVRKVASSWTGSNLRVTGAGANAQNGSFDGNIGSTAIGVGQPTTFNGVSFTGTIRNLKLYVAAASAGQLKALTT